MFAKLLIADHIHVYSNSTAEPVVVEQGTIVVALGMES